MIVKWKTSRYSGAKIERVKCTKETAQTVWYVDDYWKKERGVRKDSGGDRFHDTWEQARDFLMDSAVKQVGYARRDLQRANDFLGNVKGLKKPE